MQKNTSGASVSAQGAMVIGSSDTIRYNDTMEVQGYVISVAKAVELGLRYKLDIAQKLERDLKSKTGLLITFPIMILMDKLQREVGTGAELLELVKA